MLSVQMLHFIKTYHEREINKKNNEIKTMKPDDMKKYEKCMKETNNKIMCSQSVFGTHYDNDKNMINMFNTPR